MRRNMTDTRPRFQNPYAKSSNPYKRPRVERKDPNSAPHSTFQGDFAALPASTSHPHNPLSRQQPVHATLQESTITPSVREASTNVKTTAHTTKYSHFQGNQYSLRDSTNQAEKLDSEQKLTTSQNGTHSKPPTARTLHSSRVSSTTTDAIVSMRPASWITEPSNSTPGTRTQHSVAPSEEAASAHLPGEQPLPKELDYDPASIKPIKDNYRGKLVSNARLDKPLLNGWRLYPHQKQAIVKGLMKRRVILALDMGLGKTLIGCVWSRAFKLSFDALKVLVVCPVTLKADWRRTAEEATGLKVEPEKKAPADSLDLSIYSWGKIPDYVTERAEHFVVVCDEAHMMQTMSASRTKAALKLMKDPRCAGVLLLTGTPMKNGKPVNLFPLLRGVRHPLGRDQKAFEVHFCGGRLVNFGGRGSQWVANGTMNLKQLNRLVEVNLLHLTKEKCLKALPPMKRETRAVPISARWENKYRDAVKDLAALYQAMRTNKNLDNNAALGATQSLRSLCAFAKIGATVDLAKRILEEEPAVVVFTSFATAATAVHERLAGSGWDGVLLTGETPQNKRQGLVDKFQEGLAPVFVATFGAGGVGITLTAAQTIIFLDRPWTPGEIMQAEDRIRRIGQTKKTRSIWMSAFELDVQVDSMLADKNHATKVVLANDDANSSLTGGSAFGSKINIPKLLDSILSKAK